MAYVKKLKKGGENKEKQETKFCVTFRQLLWKPAVLLLPQTQLVHSTRRLDWAEKKEKEKKNVVQSLRHLHGHCVLCYTVEGLLFLLVILPVSKQKKGSITW